MVSLKIPGIKSWFDPISSKALSTQLMQNLDERLKGKRALFITLTYRHDDYASPIDLFRTQQERQDVPLFLRRLSRFLGTPLTGQWLRKLEFQEGGWVHFHIVVVTPQFIPHSDLTALWGFGHVWINRFSAKHVNYITKYVSKSEQVPDWILLEKPRSVKVISVSPGFWGKRDYKRYDAKYHALRGLGAYIPLGKRLEDIPKSTLVKLGSGVVSQHRVSIVYIVLLAKQQGYTVTGDGRWLQIDCPDNVMRDLIACAALRSASEASRTSLNLINKRNPDFPELPGYLTAALRALFDDRQVA